MSEPEEIRTPEFHILICQIASLENGSLALLFKRKGHSDYEVISIEELLALIYEAREAIRTPEYHILICQIAWLENGSFALLFKRKGHSDYEIISIEELLALIFEAREAIHRHGKAG